MSSRHFPRLDAYRLWLLVLASVLLAGLLAAAAVLRYGLVLTNLTDLVPWGLWITVDLSAIALSAGAFSLCAAVYLLGLDRFRPLARTATYVGLVGYTMAAMTLLLDIGRPDRFWHPIVFWNPHSVLWEVTMCVMLYLGVLSLEVAPLFGEAHWIAGRWPRLAARLRQVHQLAPYLAVAGLGLSMLHQSSLGATYGVLKARPIWYRPGISVLFIVSAVAGGVALTLLLSSLASRVSRHAHANEGRIVELAKVVGWILLGYLYLRFWDAFAMSYTSQPGRDEGLSLLLSGPLSFNFWILEIGLGILAPVAMLLRSRWRQHFWLRQLALAMVVVGVCAYRWDTTMVGQLVVLTYLPSSTLAAFTQYRPSLVELVSAAGVVAFGLLALTLGIRHLNIIDHGQPGRHVAHGAGRRLALPADLT